MEVEEGEEGGAEPMALKAEEEIEEEEEEEMSEEEEAVDSIPIVQPHPPAPLSELLALERQYHLHTLTPPPAPPPPPSPSPTPTSSPSSLAPAFNARLDLLLLPELSYLTSTIAVCQRWQSSAHLALQSPMPVEAIKQLLAEGRGLGVLMEEVEELERASWRRMWEWEVREVVKGEMDWMVGVGLLRELKRRYPAYEPMASVREEGEEEERKGMMVEEEEDDEKLHLDRDSDEEVDDRGDGDDEQQDQHGKAEPSLQLPTEDAATASPSEGPDGGPSIPSAPSTQPSLTETTRPSNSPSTALPLPEPASGIASKGTESTPMSDVATTATLSEVSLVPSAPAPEGMQVESPAMDVDGSVPAPDNAVPPAVAVDEAKATFPSPPPSTSTTPTPVDDGFLSTMAGDIRELELRVLRMWWWTCRMHALFSRRLGTVLTRLILGSNVRPLKELIESDDSDRADTARVERKPASHKRRRPTATVVPSSTTSAPSASPSPASMAEEDVDLSTLYCYCQRPYLADDVMISCDSCSCWYHITCLWLTKDDMRRIDKQQFVCPTCCEKEGKEYRWREKPPSRKKRIYGVRQELVKRRVEELRDVKGAEATRVRQLVERADDWMRRARRMLDEVLQTKEEAEEEAVLERAEREVEEEADRKRRELADRRRKAMEKKAERAERKRRVGQGSDGALVRVLIEPAGDGSGVVVRVEAVAESKEGVEGDAAAGKGDGMEDEEDSRKRSSGDHGGDDTKESEKEKGEHKGGKSEGSKGSKEKGEREPEKSRKRKAKDTNVPDSPARASRDVLDEATVVRLKEEREHRERVLAQRCACTDRLQQHLREGLSISLEMDERREVEERVRLLLTLERTERLLIANTLNTRALDASTPPSASVTRKNELKTLAELMESLTRMKAGEYREHEHEHNRVVRCFERWHARLLEWNAAVLAVLQSSSLSTSQPTSLSSLLDLQGTQRLLFAALQLPAIVDLNLRVAACLRWLPKEKKHFARQSRHSILARLLMERFGECGNVQSSWTAKVVREVERAEAWTKRVDEAIERKAGRGAFEQLLAETEGPGKVWADLTDVGVCQQYVDLFCICMQPYVDGVFMIGCDSCDDWYHPACVALTAAQAKKIKKYQCPRCCKRKGVPYPYGEVKGLPDEPDQPKQTDRGKVQGDDTAMVNDDERAKKKLRKEERARGRERAATAANGKEEEESSADEDREAERKRKKRLRKDREKEDREKEPASPVERRTAMDGGSDKGESRPASEEAAESEKKKKRRRRREKEREKGKERDSIRDRERKDTADAFHSNPLDRSAPSTSSSSLSSPVSPVKAKKRRRRSSSSSDADAPSLDKKRKRHRADGDKRRRKSAANTGAVPSSSPSRDAAGSSASESASTSHPSTPASPSASVYATLLYEHLHAVVSSEHSNILWHLFHSYMSRPLDARLMEEISEAVRLVCGEEALTAVSDSVMREYVQRTGHSALAPPRRQRSRGGGGADAGRGKDSDAERERAGSKRERRKKPKGYPRAAKSAYKFFVSFVSAHRRVELDKLVAEAGGGEKSVSRIIAEQWKKLSAEEKEVFEVDARREKDRFNHQLHRWEMQQQQQHMEDERSRADHERTAKEKQRHDRGESREGQVGAEGGKGSGQSSPSQSSTPRAAPRSLVPSLSVHAGDGDGVGPAMYYSSASSSSPSSSSPYSGYASSMIPMAAAIYSPHQLVLQQQQLQLLSNPSHAYHAHAAHLHSMQLHGGMQAMQLPLNMGMVPIGMVQGGAGGQMLYVIQSPRVDQSPRAVPASTPAGGGAERRAMLVEEVEQAGEQMEESKEATAEQGSVPPAPPLTSPTQSSMTPHTNLRLHPQFTLQSHQPQPSRAQSSTPVPIPSLAVVPGSSGSSRPPSAARVIRPQLALVADELRLPAAKEVDDGSGRAGSRPPQQQPQQSESNTAEAQGPASVQPQAEEQRAERSGAGAEVAEAPVEAASTSAAVQPQQQ